MTPPSIRATYGVYRALSVVALSDSLFGVLEGTLIVLGAAVAPGCLALAILSRRHGTWAGSLAAARFPNYPFAVLTVLHLPMSYAAVVVAPGSAVVAGLNVACAANTAPVLGLLGLMIVELQDPMGVSVDSAIAVLLASQSALAAATVALNGMLLLLSMRMDPARCLGEGLWTAPKWSPRCIRRFLWDAKDVGAAPGFVDPPLDASLELQLLAEDDVPEVMEDSGAALSVDTPCDSPTGGVPGGKCDSSTLPGNDECGADADIIVLEATGVSVSPFLPSQLSARSDLERLYDAITVFNLNSTTQPHENKIR